MRKERSGKLPAVNGASPAAAAQRALNRERPHIAGAEVMGDVVIRVTVIELPRMERILGISDRRVPGSKLGIFVGEPAVAAVGNFIEGVAPGIVQLNFARPESAGKRCEQAVVTGNGIAIDLRDYAKARIGGRGREIA